MERQLVVFELGKEQFGIEISCVEGIVKMQEITPIPFAPDCMKGITSLRGAILPVIDLAKRFEMAELPLTRDTRIVVTFIGNRKVGMIVSAVSEVVTIDENSIEPPPPLVSTVNSEFLNGIVRFDKRLVILLNLEKIIEI
jgi:purine-binding chemotaxis protein CheW